MSCASRGRDAEVTVELQIQGNRLHSFSSFLFHLSYLRSGLEPGRDAGSADFFVRHQLRLFASGGAIS